ncbi:MAG: TonB-dependent receptor [Bacteroidetes bacterium]|nr:TonB-dependent receptor [Bacteroidota bacterium]
MSRRLLLLIACLCLFLPIHAQNETFTLSGFLKDAQNGEALIGANVYVQGNTALGATTNLYGFYSLSLPKGDYQIAFSYIGYATQVQTISLNKDIRQNIELSDNTKALDEVVITDERKDENVKSTTMGKEELSIDRIKSIPALMGEVDIIKALQLMPGVQAAGEGNSGIYVRGGGPDQNLVLLDDAIVYNTGHLFGFFSVFNADAVKNTTLYKGAMPANYGGRLSSVIDIQMKEGNNKRFEMEGGIGIISSRLTIMAPFKKSKSKKTAKGSFLFSGRRTYLFDIIQPLLKKTDFAGTNYFFYDINLKANYQFSDKDRLYVSGYFGRDVFVYNSTKNQTNVKIPWGNATATVRYNHLFNDKLFMNATFVFNDYNFSFSGKQLDFSFRAKSGVRDFNTKIDLDYYLNSKHNLKFGMVYTHHRMTPTQASATSGTTDFESNINRRYSHELAWYASDEFKVNEKLKLDFGFRLSMFQHIGPYGKISGDNIAGFDTVFYKRGKPIKTYFGPEPRFAMRYAFGKNNSIKAGIALNYQYIHLVSSSNSTLPTDVWVQSSAIVKPQMALQYSVGYFRNFKEDMFETSIEVYFKHLWNQIEYGESYVGELNIDPELGYVFGKGKAYGAEFFIKKRTGKLNGWIGYTISRSDRKFKDLNEGKVFVAKYDRTHDLSINIAYNINKEWSVGATFVYATGNAITPANTLSLIEFNPMIGYSERNSYRVPAYHRMDLSLTYTPIPKRRPNRRWHSSYNFSIYNVYNRKNTYFIYNKIEGSTLTGDLKQTPINVSLFPVIPSFTWNFKF